MTDNNSEIARVSDGDNELSPELKAYFDSKGEKPMPGATEPEPAKEPAKDQEAHQPKTEAEQPADKASEPAKDADKGADVDDDDEPANPDGKRRRVEWSAYEREKRQRKETEQRLAQMQQDFTRAMQAQQQREALILEKLAKFQPTEEAKAPEAPVIPDPEQDIFGATKFAIDRIKQMEAEKQAEVARRQQQEQQYVAQQQAAEQNKMLVDEWRRYGAEKQKADPDFWPAYTYLTSSRKAELMNLGWDEARANRQVALDELAFIQQAAQTQQDPAEMIKGLARARIETLERQRAMMQPNAQPGAPASPEAPKAAASPQRLDTLAKAQEANKTLTGVGAPGSARGALTAADFGKMSADEREAFLDKFGEKGFKAMMSR